jgi:hypothetical protein
MRKAPEIGGASPSGKEAPHGVKYEIRPASAGSDTTDYNENGTLVTDAIAAARATTPTRNVSIFQASASCRAYQARLLKTCLSVEDMDNS